MNRGLDFWRRVSWRVKRKEKKDLMKKGDRKDLSKKRRNTERKKDRCETCGPYPSVLSRRNWREKRAKLSSVIDPSTAVPIHRRGEYNERHSRRKKWSRSLFSTSDGESKCSRQSSACHTHVYMLTDFLLSLLENEARLIFNSYLRRLQVFHSVSRTCSDSVHMQIDRKTKIKWEYLSLSLNHVIGTPISSTYRHALSIGIDRMQREREQNREASHGEGQGAPIVTNSHEMLNQSLLVTSIRASFSTFRTVIRKIPSPCRIIFSLDNIRPTRGNYSRF